MIVCCGLNKPGTLGCVGWDPELVRRTRHVDAVVQTRWPGVSSDETIFHVATPAFYRFNDRWYLCTQACPLPANRNYIDGKWDLWCFECTAKLPTRHGLADLFIPGTPAGK